MASPLCLSPRFGFVWRFGLLSNGDAVAGFYQARKIALCGMHWHSAHWDGPPLMLSACGQRDIETSRGNFCIIKEQLEKIAHAIE